MRDFKSLLSNIGDLERLNTAYRMRNKLTQKLKESQLRGETERAKFLSLMIEQDSAKIRDMEKIRLERVKE